MRYYKLIILTIALFAFAGCSDEERPSEDTTTGWHSQGRDCLACHNVDLGTDKHLVVAGTMFKESSVTDFDDLNSMCDSDMAIEFLDASYSVVQTSANYYDANSKGNKGRGNIFLLDRLFNSTLNGSYFVRIVDRTSGLLMAQSSGFHDFSGGAYSIDNSDDNSNRLSCNACHNGGVTAPLYVQNNSNLCK